MCRVPIFQNNMYLEEVLQAISADKLTNISTLVSSDFLFEERKLLLDCDFHLKINIFFKCIYQGNMSSFAHYLHVQSVFRQVCMKAFTSIVLAVFFLRKATLRQCHSGINS